MIELDGDKIEWLTMGGGIKAKSAPPNRYPDIQQDCLNSFPEGEVPSEPNVSVLNHVYGGWHRNPTHVFFTNGQIDLWRTLSIASFEENALNRIGTTVIPACYTAPDPSSYFGVVYRGKTHVTDLSSPLARPDEPFYASLSLFQMALDE